MVDSSPFSTNGALVVANAGPDDQDRVYRRLMKWGMSLVVVAPVLSVLAATDFLDDASSAPPVRPSSSK